jgi:AP-4 complex subunit epsilon-1
MKAAGAKLAASLPFGELDRLVKAIGECRSKAEEDRIMAAEVEALKARLSDPRLDKTRGREYMVRVGVGVVGGCRGGV